jgi:predicted HTH transcriptional regulator
MRVWLRNGAEIVAANIAMLKDLLLAKGELSERWERRISPSVSTGELDRDEIRATVRDAETASRFPFKDHNDDLMVMRDLSVLTDAGFTQGGDVLFTRSAVRRHPQCRVQLLRSSGNKSGEKIIRAARELRAPPPVWRDDPTGVTLTLFASRLSGASDFSLNERQKMLFMTLHAEDEISLSEYSARFASTVTQRQARRDLEELESFGFLERRGRARATNYRLTPKAPTLS